MPRRAVGVQAERETRGKSERSERGGREREWAQDDEQEALRHVARPDALEKEVLRGASVSNAVRHSIRNLIGDTVLEKAKKQTNFNARNCNHGQAKRVKRAGRKRAVRFD